MDGWKDMQLQIFLLVEEQIFVNSQGGSISPEKTKHHRGQPLVFHGIQWPTIGQLLTAISARATSREADV